MPVSLSEFEPTYLRVQQRDDAVIASFTVPRLSDEYNLEQLGHELFALVEQYGCRKLVVSLQGVNYLTSSGIGKLITLHRKMHRQQGAVIFCDIHEAVDDILRTSKLTTYFHVVADADAAVAALQGA